MIRKQEIEQIREINRKLPFAHPIEPGPTFAEWAEAVLHVHLSPHQIRLGEAIMRGDAIVWGRRFGKRVTEAAVRAYIEDNADATLKWLPGSETDPTAPFGRAFS